MNWTKWLFLGLWVIEGIFLALFNFFLKEKHDWANLWIMWWIGCLTILILGFLGG